MRPAIDDPIFTARAEGDARTTDLDEVRRALSLFFAPGDRHEIRALPGGRSVVVSVDDLDAAVRSIADLDGTLYHCPNPIQPGAKRANKKAVVKWRWLVVDVDPDRPGKTSATDEEKAAAARVVDAVLDLLVGLGFPMPIVVDSGNGYHLCWRVDLPNDDLSQQIVKGFFHALADRCDTGEAKIDRGVHASPHVFKLPGTWARKGPDEPDRPHRKASLTFIPDAIDVVPIDLIKALAPPPKPKAAKADAQAQAAPPAPADPFVATVGGGEVRLDNYVKGAVAREVAAVATCAVGAGRHVQLNESAFNLGLMADWPEMDSVATRADLRRVAVQNGITEAEADRTIRNGWEAGKAKGKPRPTSGKAASQPRTVDDPARHDGDPKVAALIGSGKSPIKYASAVNPEFIKFLWPGRIPLGKLTTFAGPGGVGKTFVLCDIAARVSAGLEWPFSGGEVAEPGDVLFISGEDDEADTLVPRLIECGADRGRVAFLADGFADVFSLVNLTLLGMAVDAMKAPRLVVIDPPTNYLEKINDNKNAELRTAILKPLARFAADRGLAIVLNNHTKKATGDDVDAASKVMGSVAWVNAVRSAYIFARDKQDRDKVSIAPVKHNVGRMPTTLVYSVVPTEGMAKVEWIEENHDDADGLTSSHTASAGTRAVEWIVDRFREHREWKSNDLKKAAKDAGVSHRALFGDEVAALPLFKKKITGSDGKHFWVWRAAPGWPPPEPKPAPIVVDPPDEGPPPDSAIGKFFKPF